MNESYKCPHCYSILNIGKKLILSMEIAGDKKGLCILFAKPGNYKAEFNNFSDARKGDKVEFSCPLCFHNLSSSIHSNLAEIVISYEDSKDNYKNLYFSKIIGEYATFIIDNEKKIQTFGEHQEVYKKLFCNY